MKHIITFCLAICLFLSQGVFTPTFAVVDQTSQDTINLNLTTQTLSYEDISNRDSSTSLFASVSFSVSEA